MKYTIDELINRYPTLESCKDDILKACNMLVECFRKGHKLLICGNGGSSSDANHMAGELMKSFKNPRPIDNNLKELIKSIDPINGDSIGNSIQNGLPCIVLDNHHSLNTAFINDVKDGGLYMYAQQVNVYGSKNDILLAISTSGNSKNVYNASIVAKAKGLKVISLTGKLDSLLSKISDTTIRANETETFKIQELHLPIYHFICLFIENSIY